MNASGAVSFLPAPARILSILDEAPDTRTFVLDTAACPALAAAEPGQFVLLSILGQGEAAFTISSWRGEATRGSISLTARRIGRLTRALFELPAGAVVGLRGPFGRGFPAWPASAAVLFVAGGCGLAQLRPAIEARLAERAPGTETLVVHGTRAPSARILLGDLARWRDTTAVTCVEYVEEPDASFSGDVAKAGNVLAGIDSVLATHRPDFAALCGPPAMLRATAHAVARRGVAPGRIAVAIERQMKCGVGTCGRCYVGSRYACTDGPVFTLDVLARLDRSFRLDPGQAARTGSEPLHC